MADNDKTLFISYRRSTSRHLARAVFMDLRSHGYDVFMDVDTIDSGTFDTIILNQIAARTHFVLLLTPGTLERCNEPGDWLCREIEHAMDLQRNIVPIIEEGFTYRESEDLLIGKLGELPRYNAVLLYHAYFDAAMENLRNRFLKQPAYDVKLAPTPLEERAVVQEKIAGITSQPIPTEKELSAEDYIRRGLARRARGNLEGSVDYFTEAIRLDPNNAYAYYQRGIVQKARGNLENAIADYTDAIRLNFQDGDVYYNRGVARRAKDDLEGAIADYTDAIRLNPQEALLYYDRGAARHYIGDLEGAIADYTEAINLNLQDIGIYGNRGEARQAINDRLGAIADYQKYLDLGGGLQFGNEAEVEGLISNLKKELY